MWICNVSKVKHQVHCSYTFNSSIDIAASALFEYQSRFSKSDDDTTVISEKSSETKSDWPKFSGNTKNFWHWYLAIIAQLSLSPWNEFYNPVTNMMIHSTGNTKLMKNYMPSFFSVLRGKYLKTWCQENIFVQMVYFY